VYSIWIQAPYPTPFVKDDFSPESRGFVENLYLQGLTP